MNFIIEAKMGFFNFKKPASPVPSPDLDVEEFLRIGSSLEAENEIDKAIEAIKMSENMPLFLSLFKKTEKVAKKFDIGFRPETHNIDTIYNLLISARKFLSDFNLEEAKLDYLEIIKTYNRLAADKQKLVYDDIVELYNERKSAEYLSNR